jgi:hypothetical protein
LLLVLLSCAGGAELGAQVAQFDLRAEWANISAVVDTNDPCDADEDDGGFGREWVAKAELRLRAKGQRSAEAETFQYYLDGRRSFAIIDNDDQISGSFDFDGANRTFDFRSDCIGLDIDLFRSWDHNANPLFDFNEGPPGTANPPCSLVDGLLEVHQNLAQDVGNFVPINANAGLYETQNMLPGSSQYVTRAVYNFTYIRNSLLTGLRFSTAFDEVTGTGGALGTEVCRGSRIVLEALVRPGYDGFSIQWETSVGGGQWELFRITDYASAPGQTDPLALGSAIEVDVETAVAYRAVAFTRGSGCMDPEVDAPVRLPGYTFLPSYSIPGALRYSITDACGLSQSGVMDIEALLGLAPTQEVRFTLLGRAGTGAENYSENVRVNAGEGTRFENLPPGIYDLDVEVIISGSPNCGSTLGNIEVGIIPEAVPESISLFFSQPEDCAGSQIDISLEHAMEPPLSTEVEYRLFRNGTSIRTETATWPTIFEFENLPPGGDYFVEIISRTARTDALINIFGECSVTSNTFTAPDINTTPVFSAESSLAIGCPGDATALRGITIQVLNDAGRDLLYGVSVTTSGGTEIVNTSVVGGEPLVRFVLDNDLTMADLPLTATVNTPSCAASVTVSYTPTPAPLRFVAGELTQPTDCNLLDGSYFVKVFEGTPPYEVVSTQGTVTATAQPDSFVVTGLLAGSFTIIATDELGCGTFADYQIFNPLQPLTVSVANDELIYTSCAGEMDASVTATAGAGSGNYEYRILPGPTFTPSNVFNGLGAGLYTLEVRDITTGCVSSDNFRVFDPREAAAFRYVISERGCADDPFVGTLTILAPENSTLVEGSSALPNCINVTDLQVSTDGGATYSTYPASAYVNQPLNSCRSVAFLRLELPLGDYDFRVREPGGCGGNTPLLVTASDFPTGGVPAITNVEVTDANCADETGSITVDFLNTIDRSRVSLWRFIAGGGQILVVRSPFLATQNNSYTFLNVPINEIISSADGNHNGGYFVQLETGFFQFTPGNFQQRPQGCNLYAPEGAIAEGSFVQFEVRAANALPIASHNFISEEFRCDQSGAEIEIIGGGGLAPYTYSINGGGFSEQSQYVLSEPEVSYRVRDANGCTSASMSATATGPETNSLVSVAVTNVTDYSPCRGTGQLRIETNGGVPPFTFSIFSGNSGGVNFTITYSGQDTTITLPAMQTFFSQDPNAPSPPGAYDHFYEIRDATGCDLFDSHFLYVDADLMVAPVITDVSCSGAADGSVTVTMTALPNNPNSGPFEPAEPVGTSSFRNAFVNGVAYATNPFTASGLAAGEYTVLVFDNYGCVQEFPIVVGTVNELVGNINTTPSGTCPGADNGSIIASFSGGTAPYSITLNGAPFASVAEGQAFTFSDLAAGTYLVGAVDGNGCAVTLVAGVNGPQPIFATVIAIDQPACSGVDNGAITFDVRGGTGPLTLTLEGGTPQSGPVFDNLAAGTYGTLLIVDANGCETTINLGAGAGIMLVNERNVSASPSVSNVACFGESTGSVTLTGTGGTAPYQFSDNGTDFSTNNAFTGLAAGAYDFVVRDNAGCEARLSGVVVTQPPSILTATAEVANILCNGDDDGRITITASGGTGTYRYILNGATPVSQATFTDLEPGTYNIEVVDDLGCVFELTNLLISEPTALGGTTEISPPRCADNNDGEVAIIPTGGTPPYVYRAFGDPAGFGSDSLFTNLAPGNYVFQWRDANGCLSSPSGLTVPTAPAFNLELTARSAATCGEDNGALTLALLGGVGTVSVEWSSGQTGLALTGLAPGVYTATATDENGCTATIDLVIDDAAAPEISERIAVGSGCTDDAGTATVIISGGTPPYTFNWSPGTTDSLQTGLSAGRYFVTVSDDNGCTVTDFVDVEAPVDFAYTVSSTADSCGLTNGTISLNISGGAGDFTVGWSPALSGAGPVYTGLSSGIYNFTITDNASNCAQQDVIEVGLLTGPTVSIGTVTPSLCTDGNGSVQLIVSTTNGPLTYAWSDGSTAGPVRTGMTAGDYSLTVSDATTCEVVRFATVGLQASPTVGAEIAVDSCGFGRGSIVLLVAGGTGAYTFGWDDDPNRTAPVATNLTAGTYTGSVTDGNNCSVPFSFTVDATVIPSFGPPVVTATTCGNANGAIELNVTGGAGLFTYAWSHDDALTGNRATSLTAGSYVIMVTDGFGCTDEILVFVTDTPGPSELIVSEQANTSCGLDNGALTVVVNGGTAPFSYAWSHDAEADGPEIVGLAAGDYSLTVTDQNDCEVTTTVTIGGSLSLSGSVVSQVDATCGQANGSATVSVQNATGVLTYDWGVTPEPNGPVATGLAAGNYDVVVTDELGCFLVIPVTIDNLAGPLLTLVSANNPTCVEGTGSITVSVTGGNGTLVYRWSHDADLNEPLASNLNSGDYTVVVTDASGCTDERTFSLAPPNPPVFSAPSSFPSTCGRANGSILLSVVSGEGTLSYTWSHDPDLFTDEAVGLAAGDYAVTVTDENGCTDELNVSVSDVPGPTIISATDNIATICGEDNGSLTVVVTGGTPGYDYAWSHSTTVNGPQANGLAPGDYTVTVTDANDCELEATFTVASSLAPFLTVVEENDANCGQANGSATISTTDFTGTLTYAWGITPEPNAPVATGLAAGVYEVTVTDENSCSATTIVRINNTDGPSVDAIDFIDPSCVEGTGSIALSVSDGQLPYTFEWSHDDGVVGPVQTDLNSGDYLITVTDAAGCQVIVQQRLVPPTPPFMVVEVNTSSTCGNANGAITLSVTNGVAPFDFNWAHAPNLEGPTATGLTGGDYEVALTDALGCTDLLTVTVADIAGPTSLSADVQTPTTCGLDNGELSLITTGGVNPYSYRWNHDATVSGPAQSNLASGAYSVTVTDGNGCELTATFTIDGSEAVALELVEAFDETCGQANGLATVTALNTTGEVTYVWGIDPEPNGPSAAGLSAGTYTLEIRDGNACTASLEISIGAADGPEIMLVDAVNPRCTEGTGSITVSALGGTGGLTYAWSHDSDLMTATADNLTSGVYGVTVSDDTGCTAELSQTLTVPDAPLFGVPEVSPASCGQANGAVTLFVAGGVAPLLFTWAHDPALEGNIATGLAAGEYTVTVTDNLACTDEITVSVGNNDGPETLTAAENLPTSCGFDNGVLTLVATGGALPYTYEWSHAATASGASQVGLPAGDYVVTVVDGNGCSLSATFVIGDSGPIAVSVEEVTDASCGQSNGTATISATNTTGDVSYIWDINPSPNAPTATGLGAGTYTVRATDEAGCSAMLELSIADLEGPSLNLVATTDPGCGLATGTITVSATGGAEPYTYRWSHDEDLNAATASGLSAGSYTLTVTDSNGCTDVLTQALTEPASPVITAVDLVAPDCGGSDGSLSITVSGGEGPYTYRWSHNVDLNAATASGLSAGSYTLTVTDSNGCTDVLTQALTEPEPPVIAAAGVVAADCTTSTGSISLTVSGGEGPYTYGWSHDADLDAPVADGLAPATYGVTVTDGNACSVTGEYVINEPPLIVIAATVTDATCDANDGRIILAVSGGTEPYVYRWEGRAETGPTLTDIPAGDYNLTVTGSTGCSTALVITVVGLDAGIVFGVASSTPPSCAGGNNGTIEVFAFGGDNDFNYAWSDGGAGVERNDLAAGRYGVTVTDGNNCSAVLEATLADGPGTVFNFPTADTTICRDDVLVIDLTGDYLSVSVTGDNGYASTDIVSLLETAGTYTLMVTDLNGCLGTDQLILNVTDVALTAGMVLPTDIVFGDTAVVLETSFPTAENVSWVFDDTRMQLVSQLGNQYRFVFAEVGEYDLGLVAGNGGCEDALSKRIVVHPDSSSITGNPLGRIEIRSAVIAPNPNMGQFTVDVEMNANLPLFITLYDIDGVSLDRRTLPPATNHQVAYNLSLANGTYLLGIQTAAQRRVLTMVVVN